MIVEQFPLPAKQILASAARKVVGSADYPAEDVSTTLRKKLFAGCWPCVLDD